MKYCALLRGINVGGHNKIIMADLRDVFEQMGFKEVKTYIQSGNVLFESDEPNDSEMADKIEKTLSKAFNYSSRVVVRSLPQLQKTLKDVPENWKTNDDIRCYVAFVKEPVTVADAMKHIAVKEGIDFVKEGDGVIYMTTLLSGLTKSQFGKLVSKKIFQDITIRNYRTTQKIVDLVY